MFTERSRMWLRHALRHDGVAGTGAGAANLGRGVGRWWLALTIAACLATSGHSVATAAPSGVEAAPEALRAWLPWVVRDVPDYGCPWHASSRECVWPGALLLASSRMGTFFELDVAVDATAEVPLPGGPAWWPRAVQVNGRAAAVRGRGDVPVVELERGVWRVTGFVAWSRVPESLPVAPEIGLVVHRDAEGRESIPRREANGAIWLRDRGVEETQTGPRETSIEVFRLLVDDVPQTLETRLRLRVSGEPRELELGSVLPSGWLPTGIDSPIPARLEEDGRLRVQLRPGDWTITLTARGIGDVRQLRASPQPTPWPASETWSFDPSPARRAVELRGAPGVDPRQTSMPAEWTGFPAYVLSEGVVLEIVELSRGASDPAAEQVSVQRELRLDFRGRGWSTRDVLNGHRSVARRLEVATPGSLGRADVGGNDVVITRRGDGAAGVELRDAEWRVSADVTYSERGSVPAVGWDVHATGLSATAHLPPGWTLFAVRGVDEAHTSWIQSWRLLDIFLLLLVALATRAVVGTPAAVIAVLALGIAWHTVAVPRMLWLFPLAATALATALQGRRGERTATALRWISVVALAISVSAFVWTELRVALYPQLESGAPGPDDWGTYSGPVNRFAGLQVQDGAPMPTMAAEAYPEMEAAYDEMGMKEEEGQTVGDVRLRAMPSSPRATLRSEISESSSTAARVDPAAIVQTGPGLPQWRWSAHPLHWNGPVAADQQVRFLLIPPLLTAALKVVAVLGVLALLGLIAAAGGRRRSAASSGTPRDDEESNAGGHVPSDGAGAAATLLALCVLGFALVVSPPASAQQPSGAWPTDSLLDALRSAALAPPVCGGVCAETAHMGLEARGDVLTIRAEVHVHAPTAWPLPGPESVWQPSEVTVDGVTTVALRRGDGGLVWLRLDAGVRHVELRGALRGDRVTLDFNRTPRTLTFGGAGWLIDGVRPDATPPASVQLTRERREGEVTGDAAPDELAVQAALPPWLQLERTVEIGLPWMAHYRLVRRGGSDEAVRVRIPLLEGESVVTDGVSVEEGSAVVSLSRGSTATSWSTTLTERETLTLVANVDQPWSERWTLVCSPIWTCTVEGIPPVSLHGPVDGMNRWRPMWMPWPGEEVRVLLERPVGVAGQTITVDRASVQITGGRRLRTVTLSAMVRASQGGRWNVELPSGSIVQRVSLGGRDLPSTHDDGQLTVTLPVGASQLDVEFREETRDGVVSRSPAITLEGGAVNLYTHWTVAPHRWLIWTGGPRWGPVVTIWHWLPALLLLAWALRRFAPTPLGVGAWVLLGLGMTQVPLVAPLIVVAWLVVLGLRERYPPDSAGAHNLLQIVVVALTVFAALALLSAIVEGLALRPPDMQVEGGGSWRNELHWFADRTDGSLPVATVVTLPLWLWRVTMLLWALWLAVNLLRWIRWGWGAFGVGGYWRHGEPVAPVAAATNDVTQQPPPSSPPTAEDDT